MLRRRMSLLAFSIGASGLFGQMPQAASVTDLEDLIQRAFGQNREILAVRQRVEESRGLLRQAGARPVSTIEANAGSGRLLGTQGEEEYTVAWSQPIETAGKRSTGRSSRRQTCRRCSRPTARR